MVEDAGQCSRIMGPRPSPTLAYCGALLDARLEVLGTLRLELGKAWIPWARTVLWLLAVNYPTPEPGQHVISSGTNSRLLSGQPYRRRSKHHQEVQIFNLPAYIHRDVPEASQRRNHAVPSRGSFQADRHRSLLTQRPTGASSVARGVLRR